jgi:RHS repeat-associated protein
MRDRVTCESGAHQHPVNGYPLQGTPNPLHGTQLDASAGLNYVRNRWFDAQQGRFISEDPIRLLGGINQYAYVDGDPVNARDPLGLYPDCVVTWYQFVGRANGWVGTPPTIPPGATLKSLRFSR